MNSCGVLFVRKSFHDGHAHLLTVGTHGAASLAHRAMLHSPSDKEWIAADLSWLTDARMLMGLAGAGQDRGTLMIDATHRTASSLRGQLKASATSAGASSGAPGAG